MEVLSGVASGMAVVSLSVQLLQSVGTIKSFIRGVKGASKELERLMALLDRLNALLEDVRDVMERQTSLQGQHFPAPSQMIFDALKSCEESLKSLQSLIEKCNRTLNGNASPVMKLKDNIKFSFKTKDIAEFEIRIQREIDYLQTALGLNSTKILMTTIPVLLQSHQACTTITSQSCTKGTVAQYPTGSIVEQESPLPNEVSTLTTLKSQYWTSTTLEWLGIYQRRSVQYIRYDRSGRNKLKYTMEDAISESRDILITWSFFRLGLHWDRKYPYGSFDLSPSIYPIVENIFVYYGLIRNCSVHDIQQKIGLGTLHPYIRDQYGHTLLHIAAQNRRADVCCLLMQHGLRPELSHDDMSPFMCYLIFGSTISSRGDDIGTARLLLDSTAHDDEFIRLEAAPLLVYSSLDTIEWIWMNAAAILGDQQLVYLRIFLLQRLVGLHMNCRSRILGDNELTEKIVKLTDTVTLEYYLHGNSGLLNTIFKDYSSINSQLLGASFLNLLTSLGLEVEGYMAREFKHLTGGLLYTLVKGLYRKVLFEPLDYGGWLLRWIWDLDPSMPGYLLVSEHIALGADTRFAWYWPFFEDPLRWDWETYDRRQKKIKARSIRRLANKSRKERAQTGQKRLRSKMPGAWNW